MFEEQQANSTDRDDREVTSEETASYRKELAELRAEAEANLAGWQRAQADYINYKRRNEQEKEDTIKFANAALVLKILPVLDDFERAIGSLPEELLSHPWVDGVKLIERKLRSTLEVQGLSPIKAVGEPFDPRLHEAVRQEKGKEGIVLQEAAKGYKFLDRVIRPSQVVVGMGEPETSSSEETTEDTKAV